MRLLIGLSVILILTIIGCQKKEIQNPERDLVDVGGITLDKSVFVNRYRLSKDFAKGDKITKEQVKKFIDEFFVSDYLLINEAMKQGMDKDSAITAELERLKMRAMTGMNGPLYRRVMSKPITVSAEEVKELYDQNKYAVKIAYIRVSSKHLADSLYQVLRKGADFADLAKKHSLDIQTYEKGGEVQNFLYPGTLDPEFGKVVFSLKEGQYSKPVFVTGWYHLIKVLKRKKIDQKPFEVEREYLKKKIEQFKQNRHRNQYIDSLFVRYHYQINKSLFPVIKKAFVPYDRVGQLNEKIIPKKDLKEALVTYDGGVFTLGQFVNAYNSSNYASRVPLRYDDEIENHVKTLIIGYLMYQDGLSKGLQEDAQYKFIYNRMRTQKLEREALRKLVNDKIEITDEELKNYYEQNKQEWNNQDFEKVKRYVRNRLFAQRAKEYKQDLVKKLRNKFDVIYNEKLIDAVVDTLNTMKTRMRK